MKTSTFHLRRLTTGSGILAPALFVAIFTVEGWLRPGYNALAM